jgi:hypothetical protein
MKSQSTFWIFITVGLLVLAGLSFYGWESGFFLNIFRKSGDDGGSGSVSSTDKNSFLLKKGSIGENVIKDYSDSVTAIATIETKTLRAMWKNYISQKHGYPLLFYK